MNPIYSLEVNSDQAKTVIHALDFFSRIGMCQIEEIESFLAWNGVIRDSNKREQIRYFCDQIKLLLGHPINGHAGIAQEEVPKTCRIAYDIQCVLRKQVADTERKDEFNVWHYDPMHIVKDVPLAKCTVKEQ
jgi:hypothetical protein